MLIAQYLLNLVFLPFAIHFLEQRGAPSKQCGCNPDAGLGCPVLGITVFFDCMIAVSVLEGASFLLICWLLLHFVSLSGNAEDDTEHGSIVGDQSRHVDNALNWIVFVLGTVVMVGTCACQWLIWNCKQADSFGLRHIANDVGQQPL